MSAGEGESTPAVGTRDAMRARDFLTLDSTDAYDQYFAHLAFVFGTVCRTYGEALSFELGVVRASFARLLELVRVLHLKYGYQEAYSRRLWIDISHSGFPNSEEIKAIEVDLAHRSAGLNDLPPMLAMKRALVDHLIAYRTDPLDILHKIAQRTYLEQLAAERVFMGCNPEGLTLLSVDTERKVRAYSFGWSCYDPATNRPYIHVMSFEQNDDEPPLHEEGRSHEEFLDVICQEGSRAPDVGVLALAIDDRIESVHPKIVKRICVGPLYSRCMAFALDAKDVDPLEAEMRRAFGFHAGDPNDFILFLTDEVVFSKRQEVSRSIFSPRAKVREIFYIPETNPDAYERRASVVHRHVILPHTLLQHIGTPELAEMPHLAGAKRITYDGLGGIHGL